MTVYLLMSMALNDVDYTVEMQRGTYTVCVCVFVPACRVVNRIHCPVSCDGVLYFCFCHWPVCVCFKCINGMG